MGYAARLNPKTTGEAKRRRRMEDTMRDMLSLFPDRATFEQWATARNVSDEQRAHMERFLPSRLQSQGSV